jgi:hypothetical protein
VKAGEPYSPSEAVEAVEGFALETVFMACSAAFGNLIANAVLVRRDASRAMVATKNEGRQRAAGVDAKLC